MSGVLDRSQSPLPMVSAVIPAYNCARYLPACLDSVLAQTVPPDEIILVDDGSTDGTAEMLRECYPQVNCIRQRNAGASAARNTGIEHATGDLIALGDADDMWHPQRLQCQLQALQDTPEIDLVGCVMQGITEDARSVEWASIEQAELLDVDMHLVFRWGGAIPLQTWLIRRDVFDKIGFLDPGLRVAEDLDVLLRVLAAGCKAVSLRHKLYAYRQRPGSLSKSSAPDYAICHYRALSRQRPGRVDQPAQLTEGEYWDLMPRWLVQDILSAIAHDRWDDAREIASELRHCPPSRQCHAALRRAMAVARVAERARSPLVRHAVSSLVRRASRVTRAFRQQLARRRYRS